MWTKNPVTNLLQLKILEMIVINSTFEITKGLAWLPISTINIHCTTSIWYNNGGVITEKSEIKWLVVNKNLMYRTVLWTLWQRERVGRFGRMALKHLKYHVWNELPVQVRCTILDAWGWCTGTTQRDGMGREEGGGFRMGNTCIPVVDSFWYLAKLIQLCKV